MVDLQGSEGAEAWMKESTKAKSKREGVDGQVHCCTEVRTR